MKGKSYGPLCITVLINKTGTQIGHFNKFVVSNSENHFRNIYYFRKLIKKKCPNDKCGSQCLDLNVSQSNISKALLT
jgi:hypothetical protein